jgi:hypothetical protein
MDLPFNTMALSLEDVRRRYAAALQAHKLAADLLADLEEDSPEPAVLAYRAATQALLARQTGNPFRKLNCVKQSENTFQRALALEPENVEVRYLRFSIQHHLPAFLGMSRDLETDREVVVRNLPGFRAPEPLKTEIIQFMIESGRCESDQLRQLKSWLIRA